VSTAAQRESENENHTTASFTSSSIPYTIVRLGLLALLLLLRFLLPLRLTCNTRGASYSRKPRRVLPAT
jgi:hypothetical protein